MGTSPISDPASTSATPLDELDEARGALRLAAGLWLLSYLVYLLALIVLELLFTPRDSPFNWKFLPSWMEAPAIWDSTFRVYLWLRSWLFERVFIVLSIAAGLGWAISCGLLGSVRRADTKVWIARIVAAGGFVLLIVSVIVQFNFLMLMKLLPGVSIYTIMGSLQTALALLVAIHLRGLLRHCSDRLLSAAVDPLMWGAVINLGGQTAVWLSRGRVGSNMHIVIQVAKVACGLGFAIVMLQLWISPPPDLLSARPPAEE
jgi:hypothetical protein